MIDIAEVDRDGANVAVWHNRKSQRVTNDWCHCRSRRPVQWCYASSQEGEKFFLGPWYGRRIVFGQCGGDPVINDGARIGISQLFAAERIAWCVAAATIAERLSEICSAIPFSAF